MKKIFSILILAALLFSVTAVEAQSTSPRWSTSVSGDNTGRVLTFHKLTAVDHTGADTASVTPNASVTYISATNVDSLVFQIRSSSLSHYGDEIVFLFTNGSGSHKVEFYTGFNLVTSGKIPISSSGRANVKFIFDGVAWIETSRAVQ